MAPSSMASLSILRSRFTNDEKTEGYRKDGPVSVAKFELGEGDELHQRKARALRQRQPDPCDPMEHRRRRRTRCPVRAVVLHALGRQATPCAHRCQGATGRLDGDAPRGVGLPGYDPAPLPIVSISYVHPLQCAKLYSRRAIASGIVRLFSKIADAPPSSAAAAAQRAATALRCAASVDCRNMATVHDHSCMSCSPESCPPVGTGCTQLALHQ